MLHSNSETETEFIRHPLSDLTTSNQNTHVNTAQTSPTKNSHKSIKHPSNQNIQQAFEEPASNNKDELKIIKVQPKNTNQNQNQNKKEEKKENLDHETSIQPLNTYEQDSLPKNFYAESNTPNINHEKPQKIIYLKKFTGNPRVFLTEKLRENQLARLKISRKSTIWENNIFTLLEGSSGESQMVYFKKEFKLFGTKAIIQINSNKSSLNDEEECEKPINNEIGWIESNFDGSIFDVYQSGSFGESHKLVATINYAGSTECIGGARRVKIFVNKRENSNSFPNEKINLKEEFEANPNTENIELIESLSPQYDEETKTYSVYFKTARPPKPSAHNIFFLNNESKASLKFYKVEEKEYLVDCLRSVTPLIGLSYCFSSFVFKLATE